MRDYKRFARESDESSDEDKKVKKSLNFNSAYSFLYRHRINLCTSSSCGEKRISLNENMRSGEGTEQDMNDGLDDSGGRENTVSMRKPW